MGHNQADGQTRFLWQIIFNDRLHYLRTDDCICCHYAVAYRVAWEHLNSAALFVPFQLITIRFLLMPFWNSKKQPFTMHLLQLMTSWDVVCDVWYLESQNIKPGERPIEFAERVRDIISARAGLKKVPWDGYLKYSRPRPKHIFKSNRVSRNQCYAGLSNVALVYTYTGTVL